MTYQCRNIEAETKERPRGTGVAHAVDGGKVHILRGMMGKPANRQLR